jgi:hypothetical protein
MPRSSSLALALVALAACAPPPPPPVAPPPPEPPKPPPVRAHWVFPPGRRLVKAQMPLGDKARVYAGVDGLREVARAGEGTTDAPTVELDDFLGVMKDDKGQVLFVASNGDAFPAPDPLGPLGVVRPGPLHHASSRCPPGSSEDCWRLPHDTFAWLTTGRASILGVTRDRRLFRSADYGAAWAETAYAGQGKPYGRAASIELDPQGNGLLLHFPQKVFVTHDDGATWAPIATPGIGARSIQRDGDDRLWLVGPRESARLEGTQLAVSTARKTPLVRPSEHEEREEGRRDGVETLLCGERSFVMAHVVNGDREFMSFASAPLGDKPAKPFESTELVTDGVPPLVACHGSEIVYVRPTQYGDARGSTIFRSHDWGATWAEDGKSVGLSPRDASTADVAVGPDGWTYIADLCPGPSADDNECNHRQIRVAKGTAYEDMVFTEEFAPRSFAFDREHDRVYATGVHNGSLFLYESPLTQNRWTRTRFLSGSAEQRVGMTVDDAGTLRIMMHDDVKRAWALERRPFGAEAQPTVYVPIGDGVISFAGARGIIFADDDGWETADGGDSWHRTTHIATNTLKCSSAGCMDDDGAERVGWDLPAVTDGDVLTASADVSPPAARTEEVRRPAPPPPVEPVDLICKPQGAPTTLATIPGNELVDSRGEVRWATVKHEPDGKVSVVFGTKSGIRDAQLLGPAPKPQKALPNKPTLTVTSGDRVLNDGVVAARYRVTTDKGVKQPVDVELTWWSASSGKTHKKELKKVPTFYVPSYNTFAGTPQIVDGGLLWQPASGRDVYYLRDDGKVETFSVPANMSVQSAERVGKSWILLDASSGNVGVWWSTEGATSWTRRDWGLETSGRELMALIDGKPTLAYSSRSEPEALFALGAAPSNDPPPPVVVKPGATDAVCSPTAATLRDVSYIPYAQRHVRARVELNKTDPLPAGRLTVGYRVTHVTADGSLCTSANILSGSDPKTYDTQSAFLYAEGKGFGGWWFHRVPDLKDKTKKVPVAQALTCEKGPPEPRR